MPGPIAAKFATTKAWNAFNGASFTIGTKAGNTINVAVQLQDPKAKAVSGVCFTQVFLSSSADGHTLSPTPTTSALAIGTNGTLLVIDVTGLMATVISNTSGQFDLNLIQTAGGTTYYLCVQMPDGSIVVSPAITF